MDDAPIATCHGRGHASRESGPPPGYDEEGSHAGIGAADKPSDYDGGVVMGVCYMYFSAEVMTHVDSRLSCIDRGEWKAAVGYAALSVDASVSAHLLRNPKQRPRMRLPRKVASGGPVPVSRDEDHTKVEKR